MIVKLIKDGNRRRSPTPSALHRQPRHQARLPSPSAPSSTLLSTTSAHPRGDYCNPLARRFVHRLGVSMAKTRHRKSLSSTLLPPPSTAALTVLASIVASAAANGHPLACQPAPPDFLCPGARYFQDLPSVPGPSALPTPTPNFNTPKNRAVPDSYTRGEDGRWRKISQWEFYGSTVCLVCVPSRASCPL